MSSRAGPCRRPLPGSLSDEDYAAALTRIRRANGWVVPPAAAPVGGATRIPATVEWLNNRNDLGKQQLLATGSDQSRQRREAAHRLALEVGQLRTRAGVLLPADAAHGRWHSLYKCGHPPRCGGHRRHDR